MMPIGFFWHRIESVCDAMLLPFFKPASGLLTGELEGIWKKTVLA
jgi:hypothetical protein